jgi:hypothetical protein
LPESYRLVTGKEPDAYRTLHAGCSFERPRNLTPNAHPLVVRVNLQMPQPDPVFSRKHLKPQKGDNTHVFSSPIVVPKEPITVPSEASPAWPISQLDWSPGFESSNERRASFWQ